MNNNTLYVQYFELTVKFNSKLTNIAIKTYYESDAATFANANYFVASAGQLKWYCQLNLNYSDFIENSGSSKLRINTLQVYF